MSKLNDIFMAKFTWRMNESNDDSYLMDIDGKIGEVNVINRNMRLYPEEVYIPQVESFVQRTEVGDALGQADHPGAFEGASVMKQAVLWTNVEMRGREVWGSGRILMTEAGAAVAGIIKGGGRVGISSRAHGDVEERVMENDNPFFEFNDKFEGQTYQEVQPNFGLDTYDIVVQPGFADAEVRKYREAYHKGRMTMMEALLSDGKETPVPSKKDDTKVDATRIEELEAENKALTEAADVATAESATKFDAKLSEQKAEADEKIKALEEAQITDEQKALLDRLSSIDTNKLTSALDLAEGKVDDPKDELTESQRENLALRTELAVIKERQELTEARLATEEAARKAAAERKTLEEHVKTIVADTKIPNAAEIEEWVLDHSGTPEEADKELAEFLKVSNVQAHLKGLKDTGGKPAGKDVPNAGQFDRDGGEKDLDESTLPEDGMRELQALAGGARKEVN